jgi:hypothetical protein
MFEKLLTLFADSFEFNAKPVKFTVEMPSDFSTKKVETTICIKKEYPYGDIVPFFYNHKNGQITTFDEFEVENIFHVGDFPKSLVTVTEIQADLKPKDAHSKLREIVQEELKLRN